MSNNDHRGLVERFLRDLSEAAPDADRRYSLARYDRSDRVEAWERVHRHLGPYTLSQVVAFLQEGKEPFWVSTALSAPRGSGRKPDFEPLLGMVPFAVDDWQVALECLRRVELHPKWVVRSERHDVLLFALKDGCVTLWSEEHRDTLRRIHDAFEQGGLHPLEPPVDPLRHDVVAPGTALPGGGFEPVIHQDRRAPPCTLKEILVRADGLRPPKAEATGKTFKFKTDEERYGVPPKAVEASLRRRGSSWEIRYGDAQARLADVRGMGMIAALVARPGVLVGHPELDGQPEGRDKALQRRKVRHAVALAVGKVHEALPKLGAHLKDSLKRRAGGLVYQPDLRVVLTVIEEERR